MSKANVDYKSLFKIRTITCFVGLSRADFDAKQGVETKLQNAIRVGKQVEAVLMEQGYDVQTVRVATNPFPDWISKSDPTNDLERIDAVLQQHELDFCALGSALQPSDLPICVKIVEHSPRFSCSASLNATDVVMAKAIAESIMQISKSQVEHCLHGLGNFRFCATTSKAHIPFFPAARAATSTSERVCFAIGLENGALACRLLQQCSSLDNIKSFKSEYASALLPVQMLCEETASKLSVDYLGMDTSLNPSLDENGSVARAMESLDQVREFGGPGSLAAAACITQAIQSLPGIKLTGYCGLMLPLCEDTRLAELSNAGTLTISKLLSISHVCGVGVDTVPVPGDCCENDLVALLLDVAAVASRWNKSLSCRVFPVPGKKAGDKTTFDFAHMVNATILPIEIKMLRIVYCLSLLVLSHGLTLSESRGRLSQALSSPSGKLTLSPELVIPEPADMTAILLQSNAIQTISAKVRTAKANAVFLQGSVMALKTFCNEQESAQGGFPGPLPVIYCSKYDDNTQDVADAGADGLLVSLKQSISSSDVSSILHEDSTFLETIKTARDCGLQIIPEVTIDHDFAASWSEEDFTKLLDELTEFIGEEPVAVVVSINPASDDEQETVAQAALPLVSKELRKRVALLGSIKVSGGEGRLGAETARFKEAGYAGAFLRSDCVPGFRLNPDLDTVGRFWAACINDLKSTRSKSFSFRSKNNMEKSLGTQWANLQNSVIESGALGDPNEQVSMMDASNGDFQGF
ncbi:hypothetical protein MPSEU_000025500 [Mayamaea pseudoterrestris]|nr:hypothetical protein MPSEU_000025500 [Mayamaea pseudoterrestris]